MQNQKEKIIKSPLNYTGGKGKLLDQILPLFPERINNFVDLFCGGCNVGLNINAKTKVFYNDYCKSLICLYNYLKRNSFDNILELIYKIINKYKLSLVSKYGYEYYNCNSSDGVGEYNKDKYIKLRSKFNKTKDDDKSYIELYVLIVYAFNNQIRFNSKGEFNLPVGKRDFNKNMENKLDLFIETIKKQDCVFSNKDFRKYDISKLCSEDLVYVDPPYLITCASYNENGGWSVKDEKDLLEFLDNLNEKKIKFALSNVLRSKGKENNYLIDWINTNDYVVHHLDKDYSNSNYQIKDRINKSEEVLITNY